MKRGVVLSIAVLVVTADARADESPHAISVELTPGYGRQLVPSVSHTNETSHQNGGPSIALAVTLRSPYFLAPFIQGSWLSVYSSDTRRDVPGLGVTSYSASMTAIGVVGGASFSFWKMRVRAGAGTYDLRVSADVLGDHLSTSELDMGYLFAVGGWVYGTDRLRIGAELRLDAIVQASVTMGTLGVTVSGDAVTW